MLGSVRKVAEVMGRMRAEGFTEEELRRVHAPAGVDIGSHTPDEIAVSLLAEMIAVRNGKSA
jgi:xanthine dehydrogenase accessory factor